MDLFIVKQKMFKEKKEIIQEQFQNFLSQKYCKQFHIVDNPALSFSLAKKSGAQEQTSNANNKNIQESMKKMNYFQSEKQKSNIRKFYDNLKTHASIMIESIQNCLDQGKFALSQFFQYYQLVLAGFLKSFIEQLTSECRQKGQFLQFIWSQNIKLVYKMLTFYQRADYKSEMKKNRQLYETHTKYSDFMEKQAEKLKQKSREIQKMKSIIQIMVQKLRIRRKEVKKLFKETKQLVLIVNQFKDKNTQLQYKFLSLIQSKDGYDEVQMKQISQKKERLNNVYQQIITIQKALYKNTSPINHQLNIEGPFQIQDFIKQAGEAIHSPATNQEVNAEIQVIFGRVEEDFEDTLLRIKKVNKKRMLNCDLNLDNTEKNNKQESRIAKPDTQSVYSQFSYYEKKDHDIIKNIGVQASGQTKQISYKNYSVQFNSPVWKYKHFNIYKTVDFKLRNQTPYKTEKKDLVIFCKQINQIKQIQTQQIKQQSIEELEEQRDEQFHRTAKIIKKTKLQKHKKGIKNRFSLFQASTRKISKTVEGKINIAEIKQQSIDSEKSNPRSLSTNMIQKQGKRASIDFQSRSIKQKKNIKSNRTTSFKNQRSSLFKQNNSYNQAHEGEGKNKKQFKKINNYSRFSRMSNYKNFQNLSGIQRNEKRKKFSSKIYQKVDKITNQVIKQIFQVFNSNYKVLQDFDAKNFSQKQKQQFFPNGITEHLITQTIKRKAYKKVSLKSSERHHLLGIKTKQIKWQVNKSIKNCNLKEKRMPSQAKKNYLWNIIQSVYSRTYQKIQANIEFCSFIQPLYESLIILYGSLPKQEIDKKMINFISQISYYKKDHICKSFLFFLSMDDDEKICQIVCHSDITLYLKLVKKFSYLQKPFQDISRATINYQRVQEIVPVLFREQKLSLKLADHILRNIEKQVNEGKYKKEWDQNLNEKDEPQKKLNLFYCSMTIVKQMIMVRINLKNSFLPFLSQLTGTDAGVEKQEQNEYELKLQTKSIQRIVRIFSKTKIEQIKFLDSIQKIPQLESGLININYFSSVMMVLEVTNLQDYYIKVLNKFNINKEQKRRCLLANRYKQNRKNQKEKNLTKQASDLLTLQIAENKSDLVLQYILGKQLTQLTTLIVLLISEI